MEAGMDTVVTKPFRIPDLVPRMQSLLSEYPAK
jgi:DNA-binding response OmpR family regulator